jgi:hypothetical protein
MKMTFNKKLEDMIQKYIGIHFKSLWWSLVCIVEVPVVTWDV